MEIVDFYNEAKTMAELVLESKYENTCYHTDVNIDINADYIATVCQKKKAGLRKEDFLPNVLYPESKTRYISKDEVSLELTEIILPRFEEFLVKIKDGFKALQKLKLDNSTRTDAFGMLKHLHDVGVSLVANFKKHESTLLFVRDLKNYFSDYCEPTMLCRRLKEFQLGMSIKPVEQNSKKAKKVIKQPLGEIATLIYEKLKTLPEHKAMNLPMIAQWLNDEHEINIDESTIRTNHIPQLQPYGLYHKKRIGYCLRQQ